MRLRSQSKKYSCPFVEWRVKLLPNTAIYRPSKGKRNNISVPEKRFFSDNPSDRLSKSTETATTKVWKKQEYPPGPFRMSKLKITFWSLLEQKESCGSHNWKYSRRWACLELRVRNRSLENIKDIGSDSSEPFVQPISARSCLHFGKASVDSRIRLDSHLNSLNILLDGAVVHQMRTLGVKPVMHLALIFAEMGTRDHLALKAKTTS